MLQPSSRLLTYLGTVAWGDIGPLTIYRSRRHRMVAFPKTIPERPPSENQLAQRDKFAAASKAWDTQTPQTKAAWQKACDTLSLPLTGYNLWIYHQLTGDDAVIHTIEHQSGIDLLP